MDEKKKKKCIKFKDCDLFSTPFNFTYKRDDKYTTSIGGIVTIIYVLLILTYLIYKFIEFVKRDNYEIVYLEENKDTTDILKFKESENDLAYKLEYKNNDNSEFTCEDLLDVKINYILSKRDETRGNRDKNYTNITTYSCEYDSNKKQFKKTNNSHELVYKCFHHPNKEIKNVYNDPFLHIMKLLYL